MSYRLVLTLVFAFFCLSTLVELTGRGLLRRLRDHLPSRGVPREAVLVRALILDRAELSRGRRTFQWILPAYVLAGSLGAIFWEELTGRPLSITWGLGAGIPALAGLVWLIVRAVREWREGLAALGLRYAQGEWRKVGNTFRAHEIYSGVRHGREVRIELLTDGSSLVCVRSLVPVPPFVLAGARQLVLDAGAPGPARTALASLPESAQWEGATLDAGASGIEVRRTARGRGSRFWLYDLWLAERLAHAYDEAGAA